MMLKMKCCNARDVIITDKDIETALECYKMWTSVSMGNILDVLRDCETWQSIALL